MQQTKTGKSILWSFVDRLSSQGIQFILSIIIARRLSPEDYGLVAMLSIFLAIAQTFVDSGFSNALIQKQNRTSLDCTTVFYFNVVISILLYSLLVFCAPLIAKFYNEIILNEIIIWSGLSLIINSLSTIQRTLLIIDLNFKRQAIITIIAVILSGLTGVFLAYTNCGVWTLVVQTLMYNSISCILLWISSKWHPSFNFSIKSFRELFFFGSKILGSRLLHTIYMNLYSLIIGKYYTANDLGLFNKSSNIVSNLTSNPVDLIQRVAYPIECQLQNDNKALEKKFLFFLRMTCFLIFPVCMLLFVLAEPLVQIILTPKWIESVPYIQIIGVSYILYPLMTMNTELLNAKHRSDYSFYAEIWKKLISIIILFVTLPMGVKYMCYGLLIYQFLDVFIITRYTTKIIGSLTMTRELRVIFPIFIIAVIAVLPTIIFNILKYSSSFVLFVGGTSSILLYIFLSYYTKREEIFVLFDFLKSLK